MERETIEFLKQEYQQKGQSAVYCMIGKENLIVPASYEGNVEKFIDDIFKYEKEKERYDQYNNSVSGEEEIKHLMMKEGNIWYLAPFDLVSLKMSKAEIQLISLRRALRRYKRAVSKTKRAKSEYPSKTFYTSMNEDNLNYLEGLHKKYVHSKLKSYAKKGTGWAVKQPLQMTAGIIGALPAATYFLLDTQFHFANKGKHHFIKEKVLPYIRQGLFKALVVGSLLSSTKSQAKEKMIEKLENLTTSVAKQDKSSDFKQLYEQARPIIFKSMLPTEILVCEPYADNDKQVKNTIGVGNYYYPQSGNPTDEKWILTSQYLKKHPNLKRISGEQAYELTNGWFCHRKRGQGLSVYNDLEQKLKGTNQKPWQLAAVADCYYNSEVNGNKLCAFIQKNWKDPYICARYLANITCKNPIFKKGIAKRHAFEALLYMNPNNFVDKLDYLFVKERLNKDEKKSYTTSMSVLTDNDLEILYQGLNEKNMDKINFVADRVLSYFPLQAESLRDIAIKHGLEQKLSTSSIDAAAETIYMQRKKILTEAEDFFKSQNYKASLQKFQSLLLTGAHSADIHNRMAEAYFHNNDDKNCQKHCDEILKTNQVEFYTSAYLMQAKILEKQGDKMQAEANYQLAKKYGNEKKIKIILQHLNKQGRSDYAEASVVAKRPYEVYCK